MITSATAAPPASLILLVDKSTKVKVRFYRIPRAMPFAPSSLQAFYAMLSERRDFVLAMAYPTSSAPSHPSLQSVKLRASIQVFVRRALTIPATPAELSGLCESLRNLMTELL